MSSGDRGGDAQVRSATRIEVASVVASVVAALAAGGGTFAAWRQANIATNQLKEMQRQREGAEKEAANAAKRQKLLDVQAAADKRAAEGRQDKLIETNRRLADSAAKSAQLQREQFISAQRPRLDEADGPAAIVSGLTRAKNGLGWNIPIKNYGNSAAINITDESYISTGGEDFKLVRKGTDGIIIPNRSMYFTLKFGNTLTSKEVESVLANHGPEIGIRVVLTYFDESGRRYVDEICQRIVEQSIVNCGPQNQIRSAERGNDTFGGKD
jgi:hypothetical protein